MATFEKKLILFPDLAAKKREDEYLAEFLAKADGDPFANQTQIEPEEMEYNFPDFGFNNELTFVESEPGENGMSSYWRFFGDYMAPFPKFQRLKNYIKFVTERKEDDLKDMGYPGGRYNSMGTMGAQNRNPRFSKATGPAAEKARRRALMQHQQMMLSQQQGDNRALTNDEKRFDTWNRQLQEISKHLDKGVAFVRHVKRESLETRKREAVEALQGQPPLKRTKKASPSISPSPTLTKSQSPGLRANLSHGKGRDLPTSIMTQL